MSVVFYSRPGRLRQVLRSFMVVGVVLGAETKMVSMSHAVFVLTKFTFQGNGVHGTPLSPPPPHYYTLLKYPDLSLGPTSSPGHSCSNLSSSIRFYKLCYLPCPSGNFLLVTQLFVGILMYLFSQRD